MNTLPRTISGIAEYATSVRFLLGFFFLLAIFTPRATIASILSTAPNNLGLVGYWSFEDATGTLATDFSGRGNHATLTNMESTDWSSGKRGRALLFDGVNESVYRSSVSASFGTSFTVSAWVKTSASAPQVIFGLNRSPSNIQNQVNFIMNANGTICFWDYSGSYGFNESQNSTGAVNNGQWRHVVFVRDGTSGTYYIDGQSSGTATASQNVTYGTSDLSFGADYRDSNKYWNGSLDEVRIYNRALTSGQVASLYASGQARQLQANRKNLVAHWSFEDNSGSQATDFSGKGNTALQVNMEAADWVKGRFGRALSFDGVNEYLTASTTDFVSGTSARSISGWVYPTTSSATRVPFAYGTCGTGNDTKAFGVYISTSDVLNFWGCGTGDFSTGVTISENTWTHIAVTYDGTNVKVFVNGAQAGATTARTLGSSVAFMQIGGASLLDPSNYYYPGLIDEVYVYARALSDTEVASLYSARSANYGFNVSRNAEVASGLAGLWSFNGADVSGATAYDRSGNGYNGTLTDGPVASIGRVGQALYFDGTDDRVVITSASNITGGSGSKTFAAWVKTDSFPDNEASIYLSKMYNATEVSYSQGIGKNGQVSFQTTNGVNFHAYQTSAGVVSTSTWNHIVFTYSWGTGSTAQFYVNGVAVAGSWTTGDGNVSFVDNANNLELGRLGYNAPIYYRWLRGKLDEVRIYNRILTAGEIYQLYLQGK